MANKTEEKRGFLSGFLETVEVLGNKIPDPMIFFLCLAIGTVILSFIFSTIGFSEVHPTTGETLEVYNLLSKEGLIKILTNATSNFAKFPALGLVLTAMLGVGVCDKSGLFAVALKKSLPKNKADIKTISIFIFACIMADMAGGTGFVVLPPLGAMLFSAMGKNPITGALCAYAAVSGAFASNLTITSMDVLNASFTGPAAQLVNPDFSVNPAMNWYFAAFSVIILTIVTTFVTLKWVEPRIGGSHSGHVETMEEVSEKENRALKYALFSVVLFIILICICTIPQNGILRDPETGSPISSKAPLMQSLTFLIGFLFFLPGSVYGLKSGNFKSSKNVIEALGESMSDMGPYIALTFMIAQFISFFNWSNIGIIIAIKGANAIKASGLPIVIMLVLFAIFCALLNLLIASASSKWAILSQIFVPMFMFLGYHPAVAQMTYRIGDAITNPITPGFAYFGMLLALLKKYDKNAGIGTLVANMLPYSFGFFIAMIVQLIIWFILKIPMGPNSPILLL